MAEPLISALPAILVPVIASIAAGLGAVCRLLLDGAVTSRRKRATSMPWGTIAVNLSGSLIIGLIAGVLTTGTAEVITGWVSGSSGLSHASLVVDSWQTAAVLGFVSGYTTFSTVSVQTVRLAQAGRWWGAVGTSLGQLLIAVMAVGLGWTIVRAFTGSG